MAILVIRPKSDVDCNHLTSLVHSYGITDVDSHACSESFRFKTTEYAIFWVDNHPLKTRPPVLHKFTAKALVDVLQIVERYGARWATPNELAHELKIPR